MAPIDDRIENETLRRKVIPVEEAVRAVTDGDIVAISGFTKAGSPNVFLPALAEHFGRHYCHVCSPSSTRCG